MRTVIALLLCLSFVGCATSSARYGAKVKTWEGKDQQALLKAWGKPDVVEKVGPGRTVLVYVRLKQPAVAYGEGARKIADESSARPSVPAKPLYIKCSTYFEVTPSGTISKVEYRGDECRD
jgi:hypothetical protein